MPNDSERSWGSAGEPTLFMVSLFLFACCVFPCFAQSPGGLRWTKLTDSADFGYRYGSAVVLFQDKLWVLGGYTNEGPAFASDVWSSTDGVQWTQVTAAADWVGRACHQALAFDSRIWVLGGNDNIYNGTLNDVWSSTDGVIWTEVTPAASWHGREGHTAVVFDGRMWVMGGNVVMGWTFNDVWYSEDGANWTEATDEAPWMTRSGLVSFVFNNRIWISGGWNETYGILGDTWSSSDGSTWTYEGTGLSHRSGHHVVVFDDLLVVLGGWYEGNNTNRVWYSKNGIAWTESLPVPPWDYRICDNVSVFNNKIWVLGSYDDGSGRGEVWYAEDLACLFSGTPVLGAPPLTVQFTDESTAFVSEIVEWAWDFGDGTGSYEASPSHVYENRGAYTVSLTVTNADGKTDTETKPLYVVAQGDGHAYHSADRDQDSTISLSELLRVIQFFNLDALHCLSGSEDGYAPFAGDDACAFHDADYSPPDWRISLDELLRVIQFYNAAGYEACETGEDGFCLITE